MDVYKSLLSHGANPSAGPGHDTKPLFVLLHPQMGDFPQATKLFKAGANPRLFIDDLARLVESDADIPAELVLNAIKSLRALPEIILLAATHRPSLLDGLTKLSLPLQPEVGEWHAGQRVALRTDAIKKFDETRGTLQKVRPLYARTVKARQNFASFRYGNSDLGWEIQRLESNLMSDDEMLLFATAICMYFLPEDCGGPALENRARTWARALSPTCRDSKLEQSMELDACNTIALFRRATAPGSDIPINFDPTGKNWDPASMPYSFDKLYRAKHPQGG
jgi:hypothetical protein